MSYYQYMVSVYRSCLPELNRSLRSSSVERMAGNYLRSSSVEPSVMPSRFTRAVTVGPTSYDYNYRLRSSYDYTSAMPFTYQYEMAKKRLQDRYDRASSVDYATTYRRAYTNYSAYDNKVVDYATRLDSEETTRDYINSRMYRNRYDRESSPFYRRSPSPGLEDTFRSRYDSYLNNPGRHEYSSLYDTTDVTGIYKHYRMSKQTLNNRNQRAKSPIITRELDRYYKTDKRVSYMGDISSGGSRDFRYYNYRPVPYFGGSDYYAMTKRRTTHK